MPRSRLMRFILIAGSVLILVGVSLMTWMLVTEEDRNHIKVKLDGGETEILAFEALRLVPGSQCEYTVTLKNGNADQYDLTLDFKETEERTLKKYARVKILSKETVLCDELLETVFENEGIVFPVDFKQDLNTVLKIVYYLPIEIGNEAKNAEALFDLVLTASNE